MTPRRRPRVLIEPIVCGNGRTPVRCGEPRPDRRRNALYFGSVHALNRVRGASHSGWRGFTAAPASAFGTHRNVPPGGAVGNAGARIWNRPCDQSGMPPARKYGRRRVTPGLIIETRRQHRHRLKRRKIQRAYRTTRGQHLAFRRSGPSRVGKRVLRRRCGSNIEKNLARFWLLFRVLIRTVRRRTSR